MKGKTKTEQLWNSQYLKVMLCNFKVARHDQRGTANSSILISWDFGMGVGILVGGVIAENVGFEAAFHFVALMQLLGVILFLTRTRRFYEARRLNEN